MTQSPAIRRLALVVLSFLAVTPLSGCLMVGGYSSRGGWFLWPGSFGFLLVILLLFFLLRGRR